MDEFCSLQWYRMIRSIGTGLSGWHRINQRVGVGAICCTEVGRAKWQRMTIAIYFYPKSVLMEVAPVHESAPPYFSFYFCTPYFSIFTLLALRSRLKPKYRLDSRTLHLTSYHYLLCLHNQSQSSGPPLPCYPPSSFLCH